MNTNIFRLVYSRFRGMLVAVAETVAGTGNADSGETTHHSATGGISSFQMRHAAFAALVLFGAVPRLVDAQVVGAGAHAPTVIQTQNGIAQVNINRPSGAGVSRNTYSQFDVPQAGIILNNSSTLVQTQQAGMINGNANLLPGQSARIILNQVNSNSPSQLRGYIEVAGSKAEVVVANGSGIVVNGGGWINTTRGVLTTGTPILDASGNLSRFDVTGGNIAIQGAGLNAGAVDQVDLLARAVQVNAAIYAKNLNVVTGANSINHDTLDAAAIKGDGAPSAVSIDVSQLGGMYANRIVLVGTENGVGVSSAGVIAAQAGDLTLTTQGKLVLTGKTNASGNLSVAAGDVDNSGTTYAQQFVSVNTPGVLTNSGTLAAQQGLTVNAGSVASTGTLGAGINNDGSIAQTGDLSVSATGWLSATGRNAAGGNATLQGASVNLSGSTTSTTGNLALNASGGDLNLSGATTTAGGTVKATASGTLTNDAAALSSGGAQTITAGALSNRSGQIVSGDTLTANVAGGVSNQGGTIQAAGALNAHTGSLDNTAGHVVSLNADGLSLSTVGLLNNDADGTIGGNGSVTVQAGQIANAGSITAVQNLIATAVQTLSNGGTLAANGNVNASAGMALVNFGSISAGQEAMTSAATLDNSAGSISADQLALVAGNLVNHGGTITQTGTGATTIAVAGTLDNTNGSLQTNAANLTLGPAALVNDHGTIANSGNGTLLINTGTLSNNGGTVATNGALSIEGGAVSNRGGKLAGQSSAVLKLASLDNSAGGYVGAQNVTVTDAGALDNAGGTIQANDALAVSAQSIVNDGGTIANSGTSATTVSASGALTNSGNGLIGGNGDVSVNGGSVDNADGTVIAGGAALVQSGGTLGNRAGMIQGNGTVKASAQGVIDNTGGQIEANGAGAILAVAGASLDNTDDRARADRTTCCRVRTAAIVRERRQCTARVLARRLARGRVVVPATACGNTCTDARARGGVVGVIFQVRERERARVERIPVCVGITRNQRALQVGVALNGNVEAVRARVYARLLLDTRIVAMPVAVLHADTTARATRAHADAAAGAVLMRHAVARVQLRRDVQIAADVGRDLFRLDVRPDDVRIPARSNCHTAGAVDMGVVMRHRIAIGITCGF